MQLSKNIQDHRNNFQREKKGSLLSSSYGTIQWREEYIKAKTLKHSVHKDTVGVNALLLRETDYILEMSKQLKIWNKNISYIFQNPGKASREGCRSQYICFHSSPPPKFSFFSFLFFENSYFECETSINDPLLRCEDKGNILVMIQTSVS